jgi:hypothetical protein
MIFNSLQGVEDFALGEWDGPTGDAVHRAQEASSRLRDQLPARRPPRGAGDQHRAVAVLALCDMRDAMQDLAEGHPDEDRRDDGEEWAWLAGVFARELAAPLVSFEQVHGRLCLMRKGGAA